MDAISDRDYLAGCHWPWRAERGWRIWLCICQCGPNDRYRPRHDLGLDRMDFARADDLPVGSPKILASLRATLVARLGAGSDAALMHAPSKLTLQPALLGLSRSAVYRSVAEFSGLAFQQNQTCNASPSGSIEATFVKVMTWDPHSLLPSADEKAGSSPLGMRFFDLAERYVYVVVATLLLLAAVATIGHALYSTIEKNWSGSGLLISIFSLLGDLLPVLIITEVLRTVVGFIRKREPGVKVGDLTPFL